MTINRNTSTNKGFSVGLNIILTGSKRMTQTEQDAALTVSAVRVLIVDATDNTNVLVDEIADAREFSTGSVGYGIHTKGAQFSN